MVYSVLASTTSYNIRARTVGSGPNTADHSLRKRRKQGRPRPVEPAAGIANRPEASGSGGQLSTAGPSCTGKNRNKSGLLLCPSTEMLPQRHASRVSIYPSRAVLLVVAWWRRAVAALPPRRRRRPTGTAGRPATGAYVGCKNHVGTSHACCLPSGPDHLAPVLRRSGELIWTVHGWLATSPEKS
jgi:hypothetical protein